MVLIVVVRDLAVTLLRIYGQYRKRTFATSFLAKLKTSFQMIFLYYLLIVYVGFEKNLFRFVNKKYAEILLDKDLVLYSMIFITLLTVYTGIEYFYHNRYTIKEIFK